MPLQHHEQLQVEVITPARLHHALVLPGNLSEVYFQGDIATSIEGFPTSVVAVPAPEWRFTYLPAAESSGRISTAGISEERINDLQAWIGRHELLQRAACAVTFLAAGPEHMGVGSHTPFRLAVGTGALYLAALRGVLELPGPDEIIRLSERGGTSQAGYNIFWGQAGMIFTPGHKVPRDQRVFLPSSAQRPTVFPRPYHRELLGPRGAIVPDWGFDLFYDASPDAPRISGAEERQYFLDNCPFSDEECARSLAAEREMRSAINSGDIEALSIALAGLNSAAMKGLENRLQSDRTKACLANYWERKIPGGLSSFGPLIYVCTHTRHPDLQQTARDIAAEHGLTWIKHVSPTNDGARITILDYRSGGFPGKRQLYVPLLR